MRQYLAAVALILLFTILAIHFYKNNNLYGYDEADYKYAAEKGIVANDLDQNAIPFKTFFDSGTNLGNKKSKRTDLSELIRSSDDITFYRHYHGPLYSYWLNILAIFGANNEESFRAGTIILLGILGLMLFWSELQIHRVSFLCALLPVVLLFGCEMNIITAAQLTPHAIYCVTSFAALALLSKFLITKKLSDWYLSMVMFSLALFSIEYAALIAVTFIISLFFCRKRIFDLYSPIPFFIKSLGIFIVATLIFWLGGIIKLTLLKNYLFFTYFTIFRGGEYGSGNFLDVWSQRITASPVILILSLLTILYFIFTINKHREFLPYLVYPLLIIFTSLRNTSASPTYVSSIFPPIFLLAGFALHEISMGKNRYFIPMAISAIAISCLLFLKPGKEINDQDKNNLFMEGLIKYLQSSQQSDSSIIVPRTYLPSFHYYIQNKHFSGYDEKYDDKEAIDSLLLRHTLNGFLFIGNNSTPYLFVLQKKYIMYPDTLPVAFGKITPVIYYHLQHL